MPEQELDRVLRARHVDSSPTYDKRNRRNRLAKEAGAQIPERPSDVPATERGTGISDTHSLYECRYYSKRNDTTSQIVNAGSQEAACLSAIHNAKEAPIPYAELHCHSNYSFKEGASYTAELLIQAKKLGLEALAITDHDNLCGAMEFAQAAKSVGIKAITGVELTLTTGHHL